MAYFRKFLQDLNDTFWVVPMFLVLTGLFGASVVIGFDRSGFMSQEWLRDHWLYTGGATGARTLLGVIASSTIGVAGTVFSITIAALTLAAGQMGPRLLHNFTRDRGNQIVLGIFLGTFVFSLMVLRSVRTQSEGEFVPHFALAVAVTLAMLCVASLVWFVAHMSGRINVDTVIELVSDDVRDSISRLTRDADPAPASSAAPIPCWENSTPVRDARSGYLQHLDREALAEWAHEHETAIRLLVRPGDFVFPNCTIALVTPPVEGVGEAIVAATALGATRRSTADIEFAIRQLVEVAVRALSPGVNDPLTAVAVIDRLGGTLCEMAPLQLPGGLYFRDGRLVLLRSVVDYAGLLDTMFHMIRQYGSDAPAVLVRMLEVLAAVADCELDDSRRRELKRHANLVLNDAERRIANADDLRDIRSRYETFNVMVTAGPAAVAAKDQEHATVLERRQLPRA